MKFTKTGLELCGKMCTYSNCTQKEMLDHQKKIEEEHTKYEPMTEKSDELQTELESLVNEIKSKDTIIDTIGRMETPTEETVKQLLTYSEERSKLEKEKQKLIAKIKALDEEYRDEIEGVPERINELWAEHAALHLENLTKEEFLEKATPTDVEIVKQLTTIQEMSETGIPSKDIEKLIRDNVKLNADQLLKQRKAGFR